MDLLTDRLVRLESFAVKLSSFSTKSTWPALPQMLLHLLVTPEEDPEILGWVQQLPTTQSEQPTVFKQSKPHESPV